MPSPSTRHGRASSSFPWRAMAHVSSWPLCQGAASWWPATVSQLPTGHRSWVTALTSNMSQAQTLQPPAKAGKGRDGGGDGLSHPNLHPFPLTGFTSLLTSSPGPKTHPFLPSPIFTPLARRPVADIMSLPPADASSPVLPLFPCHRSGSFRTVPPIPQTDHLCDSKLFGTFPKQGTFPCKALKPGAPQDKKEWVFHFYLFPFFVIVLCHFHNIPHMLVPTYDTDKKHK